MVLEERRDQLFERGISFFFQLVPDPHRWPLTVRECGREPGG